MKTILAETFSLLDLGFRGENLARQIIFDLTDWQTLYGEGVAGLNAQLPERSVSYPCLVTQDGNKLIWQITASDTSVAGKGKCELSYYVGEQLVKSLIFQTFVGESLADEAEVPEPYVAWVDQITEIGNAATAAKESIENMQVSANPIAAGEQPYVVKSIQEDAVHLAFHIPKGEKGDKGSIGENGVDGYTPVRGVDYWTASDIATIQGYIDERLGVIENGSY